MVLFHKFEAIFVLFKNLSLIMLFEPKRTYSFINYVNFGRPLLTTFWCDNKQYYICTKNLVKDALFCIWG